MTELLSKSPDMRFDPLDALSDEPIAGKYKLVRVVARGSMGVVFEAEQIPLRRRVAVKVLDPSPALIAEGDDMDGSLGPTDRFLLEAASAARLTHPNIAAIYDYGECTLGPARTGLHYLVMEFVEGETLAAALPTGVSMEAGEAVGIVRQVLGALRAAHAEGVIHRDIKPPNILLSRGGQVKVVDFGLAKTLDDSIQLKTQAGLILGTPAYMSPEQLLGLDATPQTDLYAVTCILARLLTGRPVYRGVTSVETMSMHLHAPIPAFPELDPQLRSLLRRGMAKRPEDRFESAASYLAALDELGSEASERAQPQGSSLRIPEEVNEAGTARPRSRTPGWVRALALTVAVSSLVCAAMAVLSWRVSTGEALEHPEAHQAQTMPEELPEQAASVVAPPQRATLISMPTGAEVSHGAEVLCSTPCELALDGRMDLVFRADGFEDLPYALQEEGAHAVTLARAPRLRPRQTRRARTAVTTTLSAPDLTPRSGSADEDGDGSSTRVMGPSGTAASPEPVDRPLGVQEIKDPFQ